MGAATALEPTSSASSTRPAPSAPSAPPDPVAPASDRRIADLVGLAVGCAVVIAYAAWTTASRSLWLDEAYTVAAINHPWLSLSRTSGTMGLYYVLMWVWGQVSMAAWWLRLPSVLFAIGTLFVTRAVALRIGGRRLAAFAVPLLALLPMFELKATEARSYSLMTLLVALSWAIALRAFDDTRLRWPLLLTVVALAGVMSHGLFVVHLAPILVLALATDDRVRNAKAVAPAIAVAAGVALVLRSSGADTIGTFTRGGPFAWFISTLQAFVEGPPPVQIVTIAVLVVGIRATVRHIGAARDRARQVAWSVPLAWAVGPAIALALMSLAFPRFNPRYLAPMAPGVALLLAAGIVGLPDLFPPSRAAARLVRPIAAVLVGGALLAALLGAEGPKEDWREAAEVVAEGHRPGDALLFANLSYAEPEQHRPPFEVAWAEVGTPERPVVVSSDRPLGLARRYEEGVRTPAEMAEAARAHPRVWIVGGDEGGAIDVDDLLEEPGFDGLELIDQWSVEKGIDVRLYSWRG